MNLSELFVGEYVHVFTLSLRLTVLLMMFIMSLRLLWDRRRKAYMTLTGALLLFIIQHVLLIVLAVRNDIALPWVHLVEQIFTVISYIYLNMAIYQLYNSTKTRDTLYFYSLIFVTLLLIFVQLQIPNWLQGTDRQIQLLQNIGLELYLFLLILIGLLTIPPRIGQTVKYQLAASGYLICHIAHIVNLYVVEEPLLPLNMIQYYIPILVYFILFLFLFDRIVELMQSIYRSSITDGLTGVYNRKFLIKRITQHMTSKVPVSLLFMDIDNFKMLNDTRGHQAGDDVLRRVAQILLDESEELGIVGRYGGEEMVVLVTESGVKPGQLAEQIRARIEKESGVTVSLGYSKYREGQTAEELIREADQAMYSAKSSGKNKVVKYTKSMSKLVGESETRPLRWN